MKLACPFCGRVNTGLSAITRVGDEPRHADDGDVAFCPACGKFAIFEDEALRKPTGMESAEIQRDEKARLITQAWRDWRVQRQ